MRVKIISKSAHTLPAYETASAAGMDIKAFIVDEMMLAPLERRLIPTGIYVELPDGYEAQIRPRSGLALKHGITVLNSPGTIDSDYRGEIKVLLINMSSEPYTVRDGDRIAQMVVAKHESIQWEPVSQMTVTARGEGGYGHTGLKN